MTERSGDRPSRLENLGELLAGQAARHGERCACIFPEEGRQLSYAALYARVRAIAARLAQRGLAPGDRVLLVLDNGEPLLGWLLAVPCQGLIAVPVSPRAGAARLTGLIGDCAPRLLVCAEGQRDALCHSLGEHLAGIPVLEAVVEVECHDPPVLPRVPADADAIINYTSGTTGTPKGVLGDHRLLLASARLHAHGQQLEANDRTVLLLPLYHMSAQCVSLLASLYVGASLVVPREFSPATFWKQVEQYRCTWLAMVPSLLAELLADSSHGPAPGDHTVRYLRSSSAPLPAALQQAFQRRFGIPVVQAMGMTEAGPVFIGPLPPGQAPPGSVGRPADCEVRFVDEHGEDLPTGESGRLRVRGPCVMKGYFGDPEATARVLDADGWLTSGDTGHRDADGFCYIDGRISEVANKGGEKIPLREIEAVLLAHPEVAHAAAVAVVDPIFGQEIAVFVVMHPGADAGERALRRYCDAQLGDFRSPIYIGVLDALPRTDIGKVRRGELVARAEQAIAGRAAPAPPAGSADADPEAGYLSQRLLIDLWQQELGVEKLDSQADFFELGGNSLKALRLCYRIRETFDIELSVSEFLGAGNIASMAALVDRQRASAPKRDAGSGPALITLQTGTTGEPVYLIPGGTGDEHTIFFLYGKLTRHLGADRPVLSFRAPGLDGRGASPGRAPELAGAYIRQLRARQPEGPYYLVGLCIGGVLAYEIAQQLRAQGEEVAALVLVDTAFPKPVRALRNRGRRAWRFGKRSVRALTTGLWERARFHVGKLRALAPGEQLSYLADKLRRAPGYYDHSTRSYMLMHPDARVARRMGHGQAAYQRSLLNYRAGEYGGALVALVSEGQMDLRGTSWRRVVRGGVHVETMAGDHYSHIRDHADDVARQLKQFIVPRHTATDAPARVSSG
ncbi:MAG: alpha/beta fold hydrolase [Gammaproteobacteria bacterium]|nr:alpha/beta fold hydrolase [Gammaproteobacteria bacterium]